MSSRPELGTLFTFHDIPTSPMDRLGMSDATGGEQRRERPSVTTKPVNRIRMRVDLMLLDSAWSQHCRPTFEDIECYQRRGETEDFAAGLIGLAMTLREILSIQILATV